jgi:hypothetical protein
MFANLEAFKTSVQTARDNAKEFSRIGVKMQRKGLSRHQEIPQHVSLARDRSEIITIIILHQAKKIDTLTVNQTNAAKHYQYLSYFL